MFDFISIIGFLACIVCIVMSIISLFRKNGKAKKFFIGIIATFILFIIGVNNSSSVKKENKTVANTKQITITSQNKDKSKNQDKNEVTTKVAKQEESITGNLKVHYINVGQGDAILIQQDKHSMLIDAGNNGDGQIIKNYLDKQGVNNLDFLIGTHPHADHIGGMDYIINSLKVGKIYMPKTTANTKTFKNVVVAAQNKGLKIKMPIVGTSFDVGQAKCTILAPNGNNYKNLNDYSIVIKVQFGSNNFLFTGDAEATSEMEMVKKSFDLKSDVLKVGHHGSKTSTCQAFLDKVNPKYAVISCGKDNKYNHPNKSTMDRLKAKRVKIYRTDESGTIVATSDGKNVTFNCKEGSYSYRDIETNNEKNTHNKKYNETSSRISTSSGVVTAVKKSKPKVNNYRKTNRSYSNKTVVNNTNISEKGKVYYTPNGKCYHSSTGCVTLRRSKHIITGTVNNCGGRRPCQKCY